MQTLNKTRYLPVTILILLLSLTTHANPGDLYAISGAGGASDDPSPSTLYQINPSTGAVIATIGATGQMRLTGLAMHPATGVLYAVESHRGSGKKLHSLNKTTGMATEIGDTDSQIPDIAFDSSGTLFGWSEDGDDLVTINLTTGLATKVGESGIATRATGLAFNSADALFLFDGKNLRTLNPNTGLGTSFVFLGEVFNNSLAFNSTDVLYAIQRTGGTTLLKTVDVTTGAITDIGDIGVAKISAIAFEPGSLVEPVPTLTEWGICTLILVLAGAAFLHVRKLQLAPVA
jgi:hypothetical protein